MMNIPLSKPSITDQDRTHIENSLESGNLAGDREYTEKATNFIEDNFGAKKALLTPSCTHALEMAAILLGIDEGDEVIVPSYTFPSTATAFMLRGANIKFVDIKRETLNIDPQDLERKITDETKAVAPIDYAGVSCEIDEIMDIASESNAKVVEDAAQGVNAKYKDSWLGTKPAFGAYSFHNTKSYTSGEGGALLVNDEEYEERAEFIRQKGTNYSKFKRGEIEKYEWVDIGSSYVMSDLQAALLYSQLKRKDEIKRKRKQIYQEYNKQLASLEEKGYLRRPRIPDNRESNYHLYYILTEDKKERTDLQKHLSEKGISSAQHYEPLHTSKMGKKMGAHKQSLPNTEELSKRILRLPMHTNIEKTQVTKISNTIEEFYRRK